MRSVRRRRNGGSGSRRQLAWRRLDGGAGVKNHALVLDASLRARPGHGAAARTVAVAGAGGSASFAFGSPAQVRQEGSCCQPGPRPTAQAQNARAGRRTHAARHAAHKRHTGGGTAPLTVPPFLCAQRWAPPRWLAPPLPRLLRPHSVLWPSCGTVFQATQFCVALDAVVRSMYEPGKGLFPDSGGLSSRILTTSSII